MITYMQLGNSSRFVEFLVYKVSKYLSGLKHGERYKTTSEYFRNDLLDPDTNAVERLRIG